MKRLTIKDESTLTASLNRISNFLVEALKGGAVDIEIKRESKSRQQEQKFNAMIGDISKTVKFEGKLYSLDVWKALLVHEFEQELLANGESLSKPGRRVRSLDGLSLVTIRPSTTGLLKKEGSQFIEFLYMKGSELDAVFTDESLQYYEEMMSR